MTHKHSDPDMTTLVERIQLRALERGGFAPKSFAKRDHLQMTWLHRLAIHGMRSWLVFSRRKRLANVLAHIQRYVKQVSTEVEDISSARSEMHSRFSPPTSRYQNEDDHYFLMEVRSTIISALSNLSSDAPQRGLIDTIDRTLLATAPIGRCNAEIRINRRGDAFAIILDDEIVRVAVQMGLLYAALVEENNGRMVLDSRLAVDKLKENGPVINAYRSIIEAFVFQGSSGIAIPVVPRSSFDTRAMATFAQLSVVFVLAHEFAHAHLGHLTRPISFGADDDDAAEAAFAVAAEMDADLLAMEVTELVCANWGCDPSLAGPAAAAILSVYASVYAAIGTQCCAQAEVGDHPWDAAIRLATLHPLPMERLRRLLPPSAPKAAWAIHVAAALHESGPSGQVGLPHPRWAKLISAMGSVAS